MNDQMSTVKALLPEDKKDVYSKYLKATCWIMLHQDKPEIKQETKDSVWEKLTTHGETLKESGLTEEHLEIIRQNCQRLVDTPIGKLSYPQLLFICRLVFGKNVDFKT